MMGNAARPPLRNDTKDAANPLADNVEAILALDEEEARKKQPLQKLFEMLGRSMEKPLFIGLIALVVISWISFNLFGREFGFSIFDSPPFQWLQGAISLASLVTSAVVLINQNSMVRQDRIRDHLQLQLIMLTEQKVAKVIELVEELRYDSPMIDDRHDPEAETLKNATHPQTVLNTIKDRLHPQDT